MCYSRVKKQIEGEWIFILKRKLKFYTKEVFKFLNFVIIALGFIIAIILIKYKPVYKVIISGEEVGYISDKQALEEQVKTDIETQTQKNVDFIDLEANPEYELKLAERTLETNEDEISNLLEENANVTYKYYEIALNNTTVELVNTIEEAEQLINVIKADENNQEELNLSIIEKHTNNEEEINTQDIEIAKTTIQEKVTKQLEEQKEKKAQEEWYNSLPSINGIKLAVTPVSGTITSRYGVSSKIRSSDHTGLDIAAKSGTPIKVVADGTVTFASRNGSYGNLVKVDHGEGVETWYAHTSKMYVEVGEQVKAGDVIATVGSTGNSTGPHLHLEIRINGEHVDPQLYMYK